jgi:hypothetical protein
MEILPTFRRLVEVDRLLVEVYAGLAHRLLLGTFQALPESCAVLAALPQTFPKSGIFFTVIFSSPATPFGLEVYPLHEPVQ